MSLWPPKYFVLSRNKAKSNKYWVSIIYTVLSLSGIKLKNQRTSPWPVRIKDKKKIKETDEIKVKT